MNIHSIFTDPQDITFKNYLHYCGIKNIGEYFSAQTIEPLEHYDNIMQIAKSILDSIEQNKTFYILQDSDQDGVLSTCVQYMYLKMIRPNLNIKVLMHDKNPKAHGLNDNEIMNQLITNASGIEGFDSQVGVLWIADAGSNDTSECKQLKEYGYDIIITDHHDKIKDNPYALIINNQYSDNVENKSLSGTGVTFKLCQAIDKLNNTNYTINLISYVHLSNIGDSCSFVNSEQHTFRVWGMSYLHPYLKPFIDTFNYNGGLNNMDFSFGIVSKINAVIRVGTLTEKQILFMALSCGKDVDSAIEICKKCKISQDKQVIDILENHIILEYGGNEYKVINNCESKVDIYLVDQKTPLTGLIANKLMSQNNKPILLVHYNSETKHYDGSVRSNVEFRELCEQSGLFDYASGHAFAFGIGWSENRHKDIINWLDSITLSEPQITVLSSHSIKSLPVRLFSEFAPNTQYIYGQGVSQPLVHIYDITFDTKDIQIMGANKRTLKLVKNNISFLWFMVSNKDKELLTTGDRKKLEIVGELGINEYNGYRNNQIIVKNFEINSVSNATLDDIF